MSNNIEIGVVVNSNSAKRGLDDVGKGIDNISNKAKASKPNVGKLGNEFKSLEGLTNKLTSSLGLGGASVSSLASQLKTLVNPLTAVVGLFALTTKGALDLAKASDTAYKASQRLGMTFSTYQKLSSAAKFAGTDISTIGSAMDSVLGHMIRLDNGNERTAKYFDALGVALVDVNGDFKDNETVFNETLIALASVEDKTERAMLAQNTLGSAAKNLAPMLDVGTDAMKEYLYGSEDAVTMSNNLAKAGGKIQDSFQRMGQELSKMYNKWVEPVVSELSTMFEMFEDSPIFDDMLVGIEVVLAGVTILTKSILKVVEAFILVGDSISVVNRGVAVVAASFTHLMLKAISTVVQAGRDLPFIGGMFNVGGISDKLNFAVDVAAAGVDSSKDDFKKGIDGLSNNFTRLMTWSTDKQLKVSDEISKNTANTAKGITTITTNSDRLKKDKDDIITLPELKLSFEQITLDPEWKRLSNEIGSRLSRTFTSVSEDSSWYDFFIKYGELLESAGVSTHKFSDMFKDVNKFASASNTSIRLDIAKLEADANANFATDDERARRKLDILNKYTKAINVIQKMGSGIDLNTIKAALETDDFLELFQFLEYRSIYSVNTLKDVYADLRPIISNPYLEAIRDIDGELAKFQVKRSQLMHDILTPPDTKVLDDAMGKITKVQSEINELSSSDNITADIQTRIDALILNKQELDNAYATLKSQFESESEMTKVSNERELDQVNRVIEMNMRVRQSYTDMVDEVSVAKDQIKLLLSDTFSADDVMNLLGSVNVWTNTGKTLMQDLGLFVEFTADEAKMLLEGLLKEFDSSIFKFERFRDKIKSIFEDRESLYNVVLQAAQVFNNQMNALTTALDENAERQHERKLERLKEAHTAELDAFRGNAKMRKQLEDKQRKEREEAEKKEQKKRKGLAILDIMTQQAVALGNVWTAATALMVKSPIAGTVFGAGMTALTLATMGAQIANVQALKDGGVVGGFRGASSGPDNTYVHARKGEMYFNASQQRELYAIANGRGRSSSPVYIEHKVIIEGNVDGNTLAQLQEQENDFLDLLERNFSKLKAYGRV
jgi:hypothetical protein